MSARTLILGGLAQSDLDMNNYRLLNLDTSNLSISGLPPSVTPPAHNFLNSWDRTNQIWGYAQPSFDDISGILSTQQQRAITQLGTISQGIWSASELVPLKVPVLNLIRAPIADLSLAGFKITNLANPVNDGDAVNKGFMDALLQGLNPKQAVAAATTLSLSLFSGLQNVDGYTLLDGDRVLVKDQVSTRHYQNGIWVAHSGAWVRATDADTSDELVGAYCNVLNGIQNQGTGWVQTTPAPIDIVGPDNGTEPLFVLFNVAPATINAGPGLQKIGNTISAVGTSGRIAIGSGIDIDPSYVGQTSITTLGTIGTGAWTAGIIGAAFGGTGLSNPGVISIVGDLRTRIVGDAPGSFACSFFLSDVTAVVLPPNGTLATLDGNETFTNKHIDASQIDSGVLLVANGGTGAANVVQAQKNLLPSQGGHAGQSLKTDGTNVFWG